MRAGSCKGPAFSFTLYGEVSKPMDYADIAYDYVEFTKRNVLISGKAGTGKTTLLKRIKSETHKNVAVVAPTGVAAINAGGVTIHSFFQLPFNTYVPESSYMGLHDDLLNRERLLSKHKLTKERIEVLKNLELLIIDEISMVRCDVMDMMNVILQHVRLNYEEPFGGVQVLMIGDLYQLAPVIKDDEWQKMRGYYESSYFFDSRVFADMRVINIELQKIYRQQDEEFISILNGVRNNNLSDEQYEKLHQCLDEYYEPRRNDGAIILTTHNQTADEINTKWLQSLKSKAVEYPAETQGQFDPRMSPADTVLLLKPGAQVMFIKNDLEKVRRYYNGKIVVVKELKDESIVVEDDEGNEIEVTRHTWENIRYEHNAKENRIDEHIIGTFKQFPLRLAWAITIHKSQGLTFDNVVIDAGRAFSPGQVYVALSRCTRLKGITLKSRISKNNFKTDERILNFYRQYTGEHVQAQYLHQEKINYQFDRLLWLFKVEDAEKLSRQWIQTITENRNILNREYLHTVDEYLLKAKSLMDIAERFTQELHHIHRAHTLPDENENIKERSAKAAAYFATHSDALLLLFQQLHLLCDNQLVVTKLQNLHQKLYAQWHKQNTLWHALKAGYHLTTLNKAIKAYETPRLTTVSKVETTNTSPHAALKQMLVSLRDELCEEYHLPAYRVATVKTIESLCEQLPQTEQELSLINGFGEQRIRQFGAAFLQVINDYCRLYQIERVALTTSSSTTKTKRAKKEKTPTHEITLQLLRTGKSIDEIARERKLVRSTIESHLSIAISKKQLYIDEIMDHARYQKIIEVVQTIQTNSVSDIKSKLKDEFSFGEIRMVLSHLKAMTNPEEV